VALLVAQGCRVWQVQVGNGLEPAGTEEQLVCSNNRRNYPNIPDTRNHISLAPKKDGRASTQPEPSEAALENITPPFVVLLNCGGQLQIRFHMSINTLLT
jgi:hypothetical protein